MGIVLDLLIVLIIALFAWLGARAGFVKSVIGFMGCLLAIAFSFSLAGTTSDFVYESFVRESISEKVYTEIDQYNPQVSNSSNTNASYTVNNIWNNCLPKYIVNTAEIFGVEKEDLHNALVGNLLEGTQEKSLIIVDTVAKPVVTNILKSVFSLLYFIIFMVLVRIITKLIVPLFNAPVIGSFNQILGGAFGTIKGFAIVFVLVTVLGVTLYLFSDSVWIFNKTSITDSVLFEYIFKLNPILPII